MNPSNYQPKEPPLPGQEMPHANGPRVLVVDDDPLMRAMTSAMLHEEGWQVFHAGNAHEATMLLKFCGQCNLPLSVVIMDLVLPGGMSGLEALAALRSLDPIVPVIATSGFFEDDALSRCLAFGFDGVLPKPYSSRQLTLALSKYAGDSLKPRSPDEVLEPTAATV
jgi:CheY-like chemotaxis protein